MANRFDNSGDGDQNIAQGDGAIGRQEKVSQEVHGDGCIFSGTGNVTVNGISPQVFAEYVSKLAVTEAALASFFKILEEQQVPLSDLDSKLREIAAQYKELLARLEIVQSEDPQVVRLKGEARQAIEAGDYAKAEELLNQAEARDVQAIEELEQAARQRRISAAASCVDNAKLQRMQAHYEKAVEYWQKAAALLPEEEKKDRSLYLHEAGDDLYRISKSKEALSFYEQSLAIRRNIHDKKGEGDTLNSIGLVYSAWRANDQAISYLEQSLVIRREAGDKEGEGATLNNISALYHVQSNYAKALSMYEQSLVIRQEIGDRKGEGVTLNNIGAVHWAQGDYKQALTRYKQSLTVCRKIRYKNLESTALNNIAEIYRVRGEYAQALSMYEQSLAISRKISNRQGETLASWNIGRVYEGQGDLNKAEQYISRAVQLAEEIGLPDLKKYRIGLTLLRVTLWMQRPGLFARLAQWLRGK